MADKTQKAASPAADKPWWEMTETDIGTMGEEPAPGPSEDRKLLDGLVSKHGGDYRKAMFEYCFRKNRFYSKPTLDSLLKGDSDESYAALPESYDAAIEADSRFAGLDFLSQIKQENFERIYSEKLDLLALSDDDKKSRQQIIEVFSYDPFKDEAIEDRPQLYRDLAGMTTEGMRKDVAKQKAALSIVRSYSNIEHYQRKITELSNSGDSGEEVQKQLDSYLKVISNIQATINQTAEKNNFTVKGLGSNGRGMLSDVLNQVGNQVVDSAVTNFYDIDTSKAIEEVADISWKSMLHQVNLSNTDYADILTNQAAIVKESVRIAKDATEALRLAKEKITKQALLDELAEDYRRKHISEEEIEEFLGRELQVSDGRD